MTPIAKSCNPIRRYNSQTSLHLTTKPNIHEYVYICVCALKSDENINRNWKIHKGALSTAPFQWLTGQLGRQIWRGERLRQTGDVLGKDNLFKSLTKNWKKQVKNKQKFVHDFLKSFPFCSKIELPIIEIKQKATPPHIHMSL